MAGIKYRAERRPEMRGRISPLARNTTIASGKENNRVSDVSRPSKGVIHQNLKPLFRQKWSSNLFGINFARRAIGLPSAREREREKAEEAYRKARKKKYVEQRREMLRAEQAKAKAVKRQEQKEERERQKSVRAVRRRANIESHHMH
jgi:hypothetical protein